MIRIFIDKVRQMTCICFIGHLYICTIRWGRLFNNLFLETSSNH
jgi:hypothetical protein